MLFNKNFHSTLINFALLPQKEYCTFVFFLNICLLTSPVNEMNTFLQLIKNNLRYFSYILTLVGTRIVEN